MPNADYSYAGFNPGAGLSDFAQTMRQGWQDQLALRQFQAQQQQQQYQNLLNTQQHEAQYGKIGGEQVDPNELAPENLQSGVQGLAQTAQDNRVTSPIYNARTGQVTSVGSGNPQGSAPSTAASPPPAQTAPTPQAKAAQAGVAAPTSPEDLKNDQAEPGLQSDGSFVAKNGNVIPANTYRHFATLGGQFDPETGGVTLSNHAATMAYQTHDKIQAALASVGSRMLGTSMTPQRATVVDNFRPPGAADLNNPLTLQKSLDSAYRADPTLQAMNKKVQGLVNPLSGAINPGSEQEYHQTLSDISDQKHQIEQDLLSRAKKGAQQAVSAPVSSSPAPSQGGPAEGQTAVSKSGRQMIFRNGQWEYK